VCGTVYYVSSFKLWESTEISVGSLLSSAEEVERDHYCLLMFDDYVFVVAALLSL
jgi:hypothetical protein